ncbi:hypothetical protein [Pumilibacter muris]|uniref:hypothetical protein n=1 Tax=Pumilibacter muris TaxID=2941510 RepID=UPI00203C7115|nr:hypothetical protein [Pumilibacter muris]
MVVYKCDLCGKEVDPAKLTTKELYYMIISNYPQMKQFDLCRQCEYDYQMAMAKASAEYIALKQKEKKDR